MFEKLDLIDWGKLTHAFGSAADVPGLIRGIVSENVAVREGAYSELYGNFFYGEKVYEASFYVVPFLIELLKDERVPEREKIVSVLVNLADRDGLGEKTGWTDCTYAAVREGRDVYIALWQQDKGVLSRQIMLLLALLQEDAVMLLTLLRERWRVETDERMKICILFAIEQLVGQDTEECRWVAWMV